jgi:hypothetical protein
LSKYEELAHVLAGFNACEDDRERVLKAYRAKKCDEAKTWKWLQKHKPWSLFWVYDRVYRHLSRLRTEVHAGLLLDATASIRFAKGGQELLQDALNRLRMDGPEWRLSQLQTYETGPWDVYHTKFDAVASAMVGVDLPTMRTFTLWRDLAQALAGYQRYDSSDSASKFVAMSLGMATRVGGLDRPADFSPDPCQGRRLWLRRLTPLTLKDLAEALAHKRRA